MTLPTGSKADTLRELLRRLQSLERGGRADQIAPPVAGPTPVAGSALAAGHLPALRLHSEGDVPSAPAVGPCAKTGPACHVDPAIETRSATRLSTGLPPLDRLLPGGGLRRGSCLEWLAEGPGVGVARLALAVVPGALRPEGICLVIDPRREFFPRGAPELGIPFDRLVVLRPRSLDDALWGAEQALRSPAVDLVIGWDELVPRGRSADRSFRRLQLAAETGGAVGVFLRPATSRRLRCWGDLRLLVEPLPGDGGARWRVTLLQCRGGVPGRWLLLEHDHETGAVRLVSELAAPTAHGGAAGA